ncbi:MAG: hypothetical protein IPN67_18415 [Bacteroidales bacterium]|nr:hypothetical protein [Bacteroidales bacterium]
MTNRPFILFISDLRQIARVSYLLFAVLLPLLLTIVLILISPLIPERYYTLTALTLISAIPIVLGLVFSRVHLKESVSDTSDNPGDSNYKMRVRIVISATTSFAVLSAVIFFTDAIPGEGWIRSIYAAVLYSLTAPFVFLISIFFSKDTLRRWILSFVLAIFLITVPVGLLLYHPWNYFAFFSPFYWAVWAWLIATPSESLMYGIISLAISVAGSFLLYRYLGRRLS